MEKTTKPTEDQTGAREGEKPHEGSSPVSKPVNDAARDPKQVNEHSPQPDKK